MTAAVSIPFLQALTAMIASSGGKRTTTLETSLATRRAARETWVLRMRAIPRPISRNAFPPMRLKNANMANAPPGVWPGLERDSARKPIISVGISNLTVVNAETINGSVNFDTFVISNTGTATTTTGGLGSDFITAGAGADTFRFTSVADSTINGASDQITGFDASNDAFRFSGIAGLNAPISFVTNFGATLAPEARLQGNLLQIDVNGDGQMTAVDMEIQLVNLTGTLSDLNFLLQ